MEQATHELTKNAVKSPERAGAFEQRMRRAGLTLLCVLPALMSAQGFARSYCAVRSDYGYNGGYLKLHCLQTSALPSSNPDNRVVVTDCECFQNTQAWNYSPESGADANAIKFSGWTTDVYTWDGSSWQLRDQGYATENGVMVPPIAGAVYLKSFYAPTNPSSCSGVSDQTTCDKAWEESNANNAWLNPLDNHYSVNAYYQCRWEINDLTGAGKCVSSRSDDSSAPVLPPPGSAFPPMPPAFNNSPKTWNQVRVFDFRQNQVQYSCPKAYRQSFLNVRSETVCSKGDEIKLPPSLIEGSPNIFVQGPELDYKIQGIQDQDSKTLRKFGTPCIYRPELVAGQCVCDPSGTETLISEARVSYADAVGVSWEPVANDPQITEQMSGDGWGAMKLVAPSSAPDDINARHQISFKAVATSKNIMDPACTKWEGDADVSKTAPKNVDLRWIWVNPDQQVLLRYNDALTQQDLNEILTVAGKLKTGLTYLNENFLAPWKTLVSAQGGTLAGMAGSSLGGKMQQTSTLAAALEGVPIGKINACLSSHASSLMALFTATREQDNSAATVTNLTAKFAKDLTVCLGVMPIDSRYAKAYALAGVVADTVKLIVQIIKTIDTLNQKTANMSAAMGKLQTLSQVTVRRAKPTDYFDAAVLPRQAPAISVTSTWRPRYTEFKTTDPRTQFTSCKALFKIAGETIEEGGTPQYMDITLQNQNKRIDVEGLGNLGKGYIVGGGFKFFYGTQNIAPMITVQKAVASDGTTLDEVFGMSDLSTIMEQISLQSIHDQVRALMDTASAIASLSMSVPAAYGVEMTKVKERAAMLQARLAAAENIIFAGAGVVSITNGEINRYDVYHDFPANKSKANCSFKPALVSPDFGVWAGMTSVFTGGNAPTAMIQALPVEYGGPRTTCKSGPYDCMPSRGEIKDLPIYSAQ